jgi:hypothetical protein
MEFVKRTIIVDPADRELVSCIKKAACMHFDMEEAMLIEDKRPTVANVRFLCFWLIAQNSQIKDYAIAELFHKKRSVVNYGIETIDVHKKIYRQTIDNLRQIALLADTFDKNYQWSIQPINIAS